VNRLYKIHIDRLFFPDGGTHVTRDRVKLNVTQIFKRSVTNVAMTRDSRNATAQRLDWSTQTCGERTDELYYERARDLVRS